ncbi:MAG: class I SAM-dependent methyltransferase [Candidatus Omnitrophota bacterium]|jgi:2-polyprenyl-3-methyl-5-hydroxy-6-metoxy-1,4-benzoquinol methylase
MQCRFCSSRLETLFVSLGESALSNAFLRKQDVQRKELRFPLDVYVCGDCFLVQLPEYESPEKIFSDYAYFSSYSDTWLKHTKAYADQMASMFSLSGTSRVVEIASNDGCLLKNFIDKGIPVLGIEPAANVALVANRSGVPTQVIFFSEATAKRLKEEGFAADLLVGNNVLAHVPDINDFVKGLKILLKPAGVITMEFPHLMQLVQGNQFDTIYHEHFSYLSFITVEKIFTRQALTIFDVEELPTHGGSLRIYARHSSDQEKGVSNRVSALKAKELAGGFGSIHAYRAFQNNVQRIKQDTIDFLAGLKRQRKTIVGYGAPAKGNTFLNYCGIGTADIPYTVDKNPHKQGSFLPGSHIPIENPEKIKETKPDYVLILPWNIKEEIMEQMSFIREWGGEFVTAIPQLKIHSKEVLEKV